MLTLSPCCLIRLLAGMGQIKQLYVLLGTVLRIRSTNQVQSSGLCHAAYDNLPGAMMMTPPLFNAICEWQPIRAKRVVGASMAHFARLRS